MLRRFVSTRRGISLVEVVIAIGLLAMAMIGMMTLLSSMVNSWKMGAESAQADSAADIAVKKLALDIIEGKFAQVVDGKLVVTFPAYDPSIGEYSRGTTGNVVTYYLSGATGSETSGTTLWRSVGANKTRLAKNIIAISFRVTNGKLISISLTGVTSPSGTTSSCQMQQSVKLRNS